MGALQADGDQEMLAPEELDNEQVVDLPAREAMTLVTTDVLATGDNVAIPINEATAVNNDSSYSVAVADADQVVHIVQTDDPTSTVTDHPGGSWGRGGRR